MTQHLLHIGFPKAGSTTLQDWFVDHPDLAASPNALAGARDGPDLARRVASEAEPPAWRVTSSEMFSYPVPEPSPDGWPAVPIGLQRERVCRALGELFPESSVLIVTRGFRAAVLSAFSQYVRTGGSRDLAGLFRARAGEAAAIWDYDGTIELYETTFPGRVCVLPYELLAADPAAFARAVEAFLGLEPAGVALRRRNPSLSAPELRWYPRLSRVVERLARRRPAVRARYRRRIGGERLRSLLARLPSAPLGVEDVPLAVVEPCYANAARLRRRPGYENLQAEYGGTPPDSGEIA